MLHRSRCTSYEPKEDNATTRKTEVDFVRMLKVNIQFGKLGNMHKKLAINELRLRNVDILPTDGIRMLATKIKETEHPGGSNLEKI